MERKPATHLGHGKKAEQRACDHLTRQGLRLLTRNYRSPFGEIDLVMEEHKTLVFVEVRFRNTERFGTPAETVGRRKQQKLRASAHHYLQRHHQTTDLPCRFDIVAISGDYEAGPINWYQNAF